MNKNDIPKEIYMYGHDHLLKVYFCSDKKYDDSEKYIHESVVKQLKKKARCWDLFKAGIENKRYSGIITNVAYMKSFIKREIEIIEQEVEADETMPG